MSKDETIKRLTEENNSLQKMVELFQKPFCPKCGVSSEFHMNLYCRKVQSLSKGIARLKQQLAEAKREVAQ